MIENNTSRTGEQALPFDVPGWINWIAQDESGVWWGYIVEPLRNDRGWYENEVGDYIRLGVTVPNNWVDSLRRVNNGS